TQDQASSVCGYSRPSIGHIENGRITLDQNRIEHIVESYEYPMSEFHRLMREEIIRDELLSVSFEIMKRLPEDKLKIVSGLLQSFSGANMREVIIDVLARVMIQLLTIAWLLVRRIFYLYLLWGGLNVGKIFK